MAAKEKPRNKTGGDLGGASKTELFKVTLSCSEQQELKRRTCEWVRP